MACVGRQVRLGKLICAAMLWRHRAGDANRRSVWICSRNDAIGNVAVMAAALGVFGTGSRWPDIGVAAIMAALALSGGWQIVGHARRELRAEPAASTSRRSGTAPRH